MKMLAADQIRHHWGHIALGLTLPSWLTAVLVQAEPLLHDLALLATFISGALASAWYLQRLGWWRKK